MAGLVGTTIGRYEILASIGKGGMGEVFRARDTELNREVAIKILPAETAREPDRLERFRREARAVAQLSHPNILEIHDFGTGDEVTFLVTELLEGKDLRTRLAGHPLPISKVVGIGASVAEGLSAAHAKGVIHRDIKPANIFLTGSGQVKILDFGLARLRGTVKGAASEPEAATLTDAGQLIGTTPYMAPEQVAGKPADARSDIFSLGCLLYEMLTGKRAFEGATVNETLVAIVSRDPIPISEVRSDVPSILDQLIRRCLEKEPAERFESARDVAFALRALENDRLPSRPISVEPPLWRRRSIRAGLVGAAVMLAVVVGWTFVGRLLPLTPKLPDRAHLAVVDFDAEGDDEGLTQIADGLTETVSASLRLLERQTRGELWVLPRRQRKPGKPWSLEKIARNHGLSLGLAGRLRLVDGRLRLELELRRPGAARPIRTAVIEDAIDNVVTFQEAPMNRVAEMLGIEVDASTLTELRETTTTVVPALTAYLSGIGRLVRAQDREAVLQAREDLAEAVARDPTYVAARAAHLLSCARLIDVGGSEDGEESCVPAGPPPDTERSPDVWAAFAEIRREQRDNAAAADAMRRAVELRSDDAELQLRLGMDLQAVGDPDAAESAFHRAVDLRPAYWEGYYWLGYVDYTRARYEATANAWRIATRCAPERAITYSNLGAVFYYLGRPDQAALMFERALAVGGEPSAVALSNLATMYFEAGRYAEAVTTFQRSLSVNDDDHRVWGYLGWSYAAGVDPERAAEPFERAAELGEEALVDDPEDAHLLAMVAGYHGMLGDRGRGFDLVERAIALDPQDPDVMATIGETLEDLGDRERALTWIARALRNGARRDRLETHPSLRALVADDRYKQLVSEADPAAVGDAS